MLVHTDNLQTSLCISSYPVLQISSKIPHRIKSELSTQNIDLIKHKTFFRIYLTKSSSCNVFIIEGMGILSAVNAHQG